MRLSLFAPLALFGAAAPAAALPPRAFACPDGDAIREPYANSCRGWYRGDLLTAASTADQIHALGLLGYDTAGFRFDDPDFVTLTNPMPILDFGRALSGETFIGITSFAKLSGPEREPVTSFYRIDFGNDRVDSVFSNGGFFGTAILYGTETTPIPEPASWALMITGFGLIGASVRGSVKRKRAHLPLSPAGRGRLA